MPYFDGDDLLRVLDTPSLIDALHDAFCRPAFAPARTQLALERGKVILMPAWRNDGYFGIKLSTVFPGNRPRGLPTVGGTYCLMDARDGTPLAIMDGRMLTLLRTAAASALAARFLARNDASVLTLVGAGALAPYLARAHAAARPLSRVYCWARRQDAAESLAETLRADGLHATATDDLQRVITLSHIVSAATLAREPLLLGRWIQPGTHIDLVGAFTPEMRETDADLVSRSRVFVDTFEGAHEEAGDLLCAIEEGAFSMDRVAGDLQALVTKKVPGRRSDEDITLFKSVGTALEDLAAAELAFRRLTEA